jgi:UPF0755 protein
LSQQPESTEKVRKNEMRAAEQANRRRAHVVKRIVVGLALLLLLAIFGWNRLCMPPARRHARVRVAIPRAAGAGRIGEILQENGIVRSGWAFALYARMHAEGRTIKAGRHTLNNDMTFDRILEALAHAEGQADEGIAVTLPEGYTLAQIASSLQTKGIASEDAFKAAARGDNPEVTGGTDLEPPPGPLEGYLFPDTYRFKPQTPAAEVAHAMLVNFGGRFARPYQREIALRGRTLNEIVTIASLIEREAKVPQDRARIAGVIENRLKRNMRLEVDAAVIYALGHHKSRLYNRDLEVESPYNTYRHRGLPPGPIANPGLDSLLAALHPEPNDFLYYVARPNGEHLFARTLAQHEANKRRARREREANKRSAPRERKVWQNSTEAHVGG